MDCQHIEYLHAKPVPFNIPQCAGELCCCKRVALQMVEEGLITDADVDVLSGKLGFRLKPIDWSQCTGDQFTCPIEVGHDHP
jgi:hypothetical protein